MKVLEPGHLYELDHLDGEGKSQLSFVDRGVGGRQPTHEGVYNQEVLRATIDVLSVLLDRVEHLDGERPWEGNPRLLRALSEAQNQLRRALLLHELRALERKFEKGTLLPEKMDVGHDGHWVLAIEDRESK